ncbi:MAG: ABC transporter permease [Acidimicrobiales bacterium]
MTSALRRYTPPAALLLALLAAWEAVVRVRNTAPYVLPAPSRIWTAFVATRRVLPGHVRATLFEAVLGIGLGAAVGVALAVVVVLWPLARRTLYPLLVASQTIPIIVLAPLLVLWFGFGYTPKVVVVVLIVFFPVAVSTAAGLSGVDRELVELVRSMGGGRRAVLRLVLLPGAIPAFFAGLQISAAYAVAGAVFGELIGAEAGLGLFISRSQRAFRVDQVFVGVAAVALLSMALFGVVHALARLASPWRYIGNQDNGRETP